MEKFCLYINQINGLDRIICSNKLSYSEVYALMGYVDLSKKNYLNSKDIIGLVGKATQKELLQVFKYLDKGRTGQVRLQQLQIALGNPQLTTSNTSKDYIFPKFYKMIDNIKGKSAYMDNLLTKYSFRITELKQIYQNLVQGHILSRDHLISVMEFEFKKNNLKWTNNCSQFLLDIFPSQNISQEKFIETFLIKNQVKLGEQLYEKSLSNKVESTEQIGIKKHNQYLSQTFLHKNYSTSNLHKRIDNFEDKPFSKTFLQPKQNQCIKIKKDFQKIEKNVHQIFSSIQVRRQKIRQDSQERKKHIEKEYHLKKQSYGVIQRKENISQPLKRHSIAIKDLVSQKMELKQSKQEKPFLKSASKQSLSKPQHSKPLHSQLNQVKSKHWPSTSNFGTTDIKKKYLNAESQIKIADEKKLQLINHSKSKSSITYEQSSEQSINSSSKIQSSNSISQESKSSFSTFAIDEFSKENAIKKAQESASKKMQQINRKVMQQMLEKRYKYNHQQDFKLMVRS